MSARIGRQTIVALLLSGFGAIAYAQSSSMTFFITSSDLGKGADYGGLAGADKACQTLAAAVGAGGPTWHAYLSTQGPSAVNARDRIGKGPTFTAAETISTSKQLWMKRARWSTDAAIRQTSTTS